LTKAPPANDQPERAVLSRILKVAQEWGYVDQVPRVKAFRENPPRIEWLKPEQAESGPVRARLGKDEAGIGAAGDQDIHPRAPHDGV